MSQIMEKTLASIPKLLTQSLIGGGGSKTSQRQPRQAPAMEVQSFMRIVHRAKSKSHEARIVHSELSNVQSKLKQKDLLSSPGILHSCFTKVLFCHLLGYNVGFIAIHAVNLAQQGRGFDKRLGYLMSCLLLNPHHEMVMLMMATLLRDLKSSNMGDNCVALKVAGELVDEDSIPTILPEVIKKFKHQHDLVREKAIHCFGALYRRSPELLQPEVGRLNVFLSSRDPGVVMAAMNIFVTLTSKNPSHYVGLGSSFLHILNQINHRGFGSSYYYNMIPLPWLQIALLKVLGNVGHEDGHLSANVCPILKSLIEKTKVSVPISLAVLVESILTATKIHPNEALLHLCSRCMMKLLASDSSEDMRYQGLGLLIALSRIKPSFASQHQIAVIECLTNEDPTIQSRTTLLLHAMANRANVKAICSKLFEQLEKTKESNSRLDILMMISDLAERLSPDFDWYISINLKILSHELHQNFKDKIAGLVLRKVEGIGIENDLIDEKSAKNLTESLISILDKQNYELAEFSLAVQLLGMLAPILATDFSTDSFLDIIAKCLYFCPNSLTHCNSTSTIYSPLYFGDKKENDNHSSTDMIKLKSLCITAVGKLVLHECIPPASVLSWLDLVRAEIDSKNSFLLSDLEELADTAKHLQYLKPSAAIFFQRNQTIDFSLSFLDSLVVKDMLESNECYKPLYLRRQENLPLDLEQSPVAITTVKDSATPSMISSEDSITSDSQAHQPTRRVPSKWRDDDMEDEDELDNEWSMTSPLMENSEKFILVDSDKSVEDSMRKKKAAEELFAGLEELDCDKSEHSISESTFTKSNSTSRIKKGKSIWDDDEEEEEKDHKKLSIFDVGKIGLNPFGISKKSKPKSKQWSSSELEGSHGEESVKAMESFINNNNNNDNLYNSFLYTSQSEECESPVTFTESFLSDDDLPWSDHKESLSTVEEAVPSLYSSNAVIDSADSASFATSLSESTVDALTDSDPDAIDS